jgi:hypothetical protein
MRKLREYGIVRGFFRSLLASHRSDDPIVGMIEQLGAIGRSKDCSVKLGQ